MPWAHPDIEASHREAINRGVIQGNLDHFADLPWDDQETRHQSLVATLALMNQLDIQVINPPWTPEPPVVEPPPVEPPPPPPDDGVPFLSRPARSPFTVDGGTDVELTNFSITGGSVSNPQGIAVTLRNVNGAHIHHIDVANCIGGIYLHNCTDVVIEDYRARNIGNGTKGSGKSNYVQFAESRGGAVRNSTFIGGRTEDMISTWHSGGWGVGNELIIEDNHLEGYLTNQPNARAWISNSGTGIILSDGRGSSKNGHIIVRNNTLINPGQVGIQHIDGPNLKTYGNVVYGEANPRSNQPFASWEGQPQAEVYDNVHRWYKPNGTPTSGWFHVAVDFHDNTFDPNLDPQRVTL